MQRYLTDRKRAQGLGAGHDGTMHHWQMMVSSMALVFIVPIFIITFAIGYSGDHAEVVAYFGRPIPAIITALSLIVTIRHVMNETIVAVEDYVPGTAGKITIVVVTWFSYILIAVGLFALARMAL